MLIEVMVGAVVLAIASVAIFNGLDGAQSVGAGNKARSVQSALAQQDIERLRAIPITALSNYRESRTVDIAGVDYTVVSRTDWVRDSTGIVGCTSDQQAAEYLKLSSTVTSRTTTDSPVKETSLLTPPAGALSATAGTATVRITGRDGQPRPDVSVGLSGPSSFSERTDEQGCAIFGYIPAGSYVAQVAGQVTPASTVPAQEDVVVYAGKATLANMQVELPAALRATFVPPAGNTFTPGTAVVWDSITVTNSSLPGTTKVFPRPGGKGSTVDAASLFPFIDGVGVYAGSCAKNNPSTYPNQGSYFQPANPDDRGFTALDPGDAMRFVDVEMPTLRIPVKKSNNSSFRPEVTIAPVATDGCGTTPVYQFRTPTNAVTTNFNVALPFGTYRICADDSSRYAVIASVNLTKAPADPNKVTATMSIPSSGSTSSGNCPK